MPPRLRVGPRPRRPGRRTAGLSRETIVAAALRDIDEHGLESFSIRRLAARLGVYPTAVTWHVPNRSALLADVVHLVFEDVIPHRFPESWQGYLRGLFRSFRDAIRRHPNVAPLIGTQLVSNAGMDFEFIERLLGALTHAGLTGSRLVWAYNAVIAALVGFSTMEFAAEPAEGKDEWQREMSGRLKAVSAARYPVLAANLELLANRAFILRWESGRRRPMDEAFDAFVEIVIAGLESLVDGTGRRSTPPRGLTGAARKGR